MPKFVHTLFSGEGSSLRVLGRMGKSVWAYVHLPIRRPYAFVSDGSGMRVRDVWHCPYTTHTSNVWKPPSLGRGVQERKKSGKAEKFGWWNEAKMTRRFYEDGEMKPKLLVHPSQARTISNPVEVERLLSQGWVLAAPKPKTVMAKRMRSLRARRRAEGWVNLTLWLDAEQAAAVKASQRPSETVVEMLMRLIRKQGLLG